MVSEQLCLSNLSSTSRTGLESDTFGLESQNLSLLKKKKTGVLLDWMMFQHLMQNSRDRYRMKERIKCFFIVGLELLCPTSQLIESRTGLDHEAFGLES